MQDLNPFKSLSVGPMLLSVGLNIPASVVAGFLFRFASQFSPEASRGTYRIIRVNDVVWTVQFRFLPSFEQAFCLLIENFCVENALDQVYPEAEADQEVSQKDSFPFKLITALCETFRHAYESVAPFGVKLSAQIANEFQIAVFSHQPYQYSFEDENRFYHTVKFNPVPENEGEYFTVHVSNDSQVEGARANGFTVNLNRIVREKLAGQAETLSRAENA